LHGCACGAHMGAWEHMNGWSRVVAVHIF
jgi:hypothetical protein